MHDGGVRVGKMVGQDVVGNGDLVLPDLDGFDFSVWWVGFGVGHSSLPMK
jgi:hypothetical protein